MNTSLKLKRLMLEEPLLSLAVAESVTAGQVQARIAAVSGASKYFRGGVTAYTLEQKVKLLGVDREEAGRVNSVSAAVADAMALGACRLFGAEVGVATTGYAEPLQSEGVWAPFVWWAVAIRPGTAFAKTSHGRMEFPGATRVEAQALAAEAALAELIAAVREARM